MDSVVMQVSCPGCNAVFELPTEFAGQAGECTECGTIFEIPTLAELGIEAPAAEAPAPAAEAPAPSAPEPQQQAAAPAPDAEPAIGKGKQLDPEVGETTNTIKLSRSSIGMVPDLSGKDDGFKVDIVQKPTTQSDTKTSNKKVFTKTRTSISKKRVEKQQSEAENAAPAPAPPKPKKKWWQFWK